MFSVKMGAGRRPLLGRLGFAFFCHVAFKDAGEFP